MQDAAIIAKIASVLERERMDLHKTFVAMDREGRGSISVDEFKQGLERVGRLGLVGRFTASPMLTSIAPTA